MNPVTNVTVSLFGYSHTYTDDVDVLLVGPKGQKVALMFGAGDETTLAGTTATNINLVFRDDAASLLPDKGVTTLQSGTYRPTNYYPGDSLQAPAPSGPYSSLLSVFNGVDPNGTWSLYVEDLSPNDSGNISGGWNMTFTVAPEPSTLGLLLPLLTALGYKFLRKRIRSGILRVSFLP